jgi:hypothetical protein
MIGDIVLSVSLPKKKMRDPAKDRAFLAMPLNLSPLCGGCWRYALTSAMASLDRNDPGVLVPAYQP